MGHTAFFVPVNKGTPFGAMKRVERIVEKFDLLLTTCLRGGPKHKKVLDTISIKKVPDTVS